MTGVLIKREHTQKHRADCDMETEAETGVMDLQAKELTCVEAC